VDLEVFGFEEMAESATGVRIKPDKKNV